MQGDVYYHRPMSDCGRAKLALSPSHNLPSANRLTESYRLDCRKHPVRLSLVVSTFGVVSHDIIVRK